MDMTCYVVEKQPHAKKVDIRLAFALATVNNVNPAVVKTVVQKLQSCVKTELTGLDWGTENVGNMLEFLLEKVETGVRG